MNTKRQASFQGMEWIVVSAAALISLSIVLNGMVAQTLESLSVATVILALYVAVMSYLLGGIAVVFLLLWMFLRRKPALRNPTSFFLHKLRSVSTLRRVRAADWFA
jgi:hypothetical protein